MALARATRAAPTVGRARPRLGPPLPARSRLAEFRNEALGLGITLMPWQETVARYLTALGKDDRWLFGEVASIVARQNGKTELLVPYIAFHLRAGHRIMHTAQNRELPREVFGRVADLLMGRPKDADLPWLKRKPRFANGQEEILTTNGGHYRIVAPTRGGARGPSNDVVIIDELREMDDFDFIAAAKPTLTASTNPQILYLSNAGTDESVVINALRKRAVEDERLAYLEWSAAPERPADDRAGWLESNPSIGHMPQIMPYLEGEYRANLLAGTMAIFETEHLCRWVPTMRERLVNDHDWGLCFTADPLVPLRPVMGISMDPSGKRAAAVLAWQANETIGLRLLFDVWGEPIDTDRLGKDMKELAAKAGVTVVGFDPITDAALAKYFRKAKGIASREFANATSTFAIAVKGNRIRYGQTEAPITDDLTWTARKAHDESGHFEAVRADDDRPIPAALAAIRAVGLASGPKPSAPRLM